MVEICHIFWQNRLLFSPVTVAMLAGWLLDHNDAILSPTAMHICFLP
jgi:hypothetical protein